MILHRSRGVKVDLGGVFNYASALSSNNSTLFGVIAIELNCSKSC